MRKVVSRSPVNTASKASEVANSPCCQRSVWSNRIGLTWMTSTVFPMCSNGIKSSTERPPLRSWIVAIRALSGGLGWRRGFMNDLDFVLRACRRLFLGRSRARFDFDRRLGPGRFARLFGVLTLLVPRLLVRLVVLFVRMAHCRLLPVRAEKPAHDQRERADQGADQKSADLRLGHWVRERVEDRADQRHHNQ